MDIPYIFLERWEVNQCATEYCYDGITQGSLVMDIGACSGIFSLFAERMGATVAAVEPLPPPSFYLHRFLNQGNYSLYHYAHGNGNPQHVSWGGKKKVMETYTLFQLYIMIFKPDFIKIDTEGSEWTIQPEELATIPRFEIEFHYPPIATPNPLLIKALSSTHTLSWGKSEPLVKIVHGWIK